MGRVFPLSVLQLKIHTVTPGGKKRTNGANSPNALVRKPGKGHAFFPQLWQGLHQPFTGAALGFVHV